MEKQGLKNIQHRSLGERNLLVRSDDEKSLAKNRRVEIILEHYQISGLDELVQLIQKPNKQIQRFQNESAQTLKFKKGTNITIPAESFVFEDGTEVTGEIELHVIEAFSFTDFIEHDLHTSSKGRILETGGMVKIEATANGKTVFLKEGASLEVVYPEQEVKEDMQLFNGEASVLIGDPDTPSNLDTVFGPSGQIDWALSDNDIHLLTDPKKININLEDLVKENIDLGDKPNLSFSKMPGYPSLGRKPNDARIPVKPDLEKIEIPLTNFQKTFMSAAKKEKKKKQLFDKKMKDYDKSMVAYEKGHKKYLEKLAEYEKQKPLIEAAQKEWLSEVDHRLELIYAYKVEREKFIGQERVYNALRYGKSNYKKKPDLEVLRTFHRIAKGEQVIGKKFSEKIHFKAFGDQLNQVAKLKNLSLDHIDKKPPLGFSKEYFKIIAKLKAKKLESDFAKTGTISSKNLNQYVAKVNQLGWINVDRFLKMDKNKLASLSIKNQSIKTKFYCVFKNSRSLLHPVFSKSTFHFRTLPKNQEYRIIGIQLDGGKPKMAIEDVYLSDNQDLNVRFVSVGLDEIRQAFNELEGFSM